MISAAPGRDSSRLRLVLLVDRDDDTREMYSEYFASAAVAIQQAADGRDALAKAIANPPDLVVTETRLPGIDGYELCALLRSEPKTKTIPIVVVTGDGYQTDIAHAQASGANLVLIKPCLPQVLLAEMRRLVAESPEEPRRPSPKASMTRAGNRHVTLTPPAAPPVLVCPTCHQFLIYQRSHVGASGQRHREQWDYFECATGCGAFQFRQRTQALRRV
jgi:two-component system cell cycle response regulator DivK